MLRSRPNTTSTCRVNSVEKITFRSFSFSNAVLPMPRHRIQSLTDIPQTRPAGGRKGLLSWAADSCRSFWMKSLYAYALLVGAVLIVQRAFCGAFWWVRACDMVEMRSTRKRFHSHECVLPETYRDSSDWICFGGSGSTFFVVALHRWPKVPRWCLGGFFLSWSWVEPVA